MYKLAELLKAVNAYERDIKCSLICQDDNTEWCDYLRQIKWKCGQIGINPVHALNSIYSKLD